MKTSETEDGRNPIFFLFLYSLILGCQLGGLSNNLDSHGSVILIEPLWSFGNLIWFYFAGLFVFFSLKEKNRLLKIAYFLGGVSFLLTKSVINVIGYKSLYAVKIVILFAVTCLLLQYLQKNIKKYMPSCSESNREKN
jgi:hypothetical protein